MLWLILVFQIFIGQLHFDGAHTISSPIKPFTKYRYTIELEKDLADLHWTIDETAGEITFELHIKTTGWIALGISPAGGMLGADIGIGWVDHEGVVHFQDRYASGYIKPVLDSTTIDWHVIQGTEQNGWTAIQFNRLLDTCDTMDVPIKSGTNILIFAYGLTDPNINHADGDISYHENRRGSRIIPLRSYSEPPSESEFDGFDSFEFRMNNYLVPTTDTTYYCKVFKLPDRLQTKHHAIAHKVLVDSTNRDLVHHMDMYECKFHLTVLDNSNLPEGECDQIVAQTKECLSNIAVVWSVGADYISEYTPDLGYPMGGEFPIKYFMIQIHYDNPRFLSNRRDNSGIKFYLDETLRRYDIGYISLGILSSPYGITIPPHVHQFMIDSYCPMNFTKKIPETGITVIGAIPHTHLQGRSVWTKLIRNNRAVDYLFNAESFNFNYQFENRLPKFIKLYPGDELATRCVYNTENKDNITLGGEKTKDEMCIHTFMYYPRREDLFLCRTDIDFSSWQNFLENSSDIQDWNKFKELLYTLKWTPTIAERWQQFYNNASRRLFSWNGETVDQLVLGPIPSYEDLPSEQCQ